MTTNINNSPEYACRTCAKQECGCKDTECQLPCHFYTEQAEQEPVALASFDNAYSKACNSSNPQDWMEAALLAQQLRTAPVRTKNLTEQQALEKLCNYINQNFKTQKEAAKSFEVTESFLSMVLNGKKPITKEMAHQLSLTRQTMFLELTSPASGKAAPIRTKDLTDGEIEDVCCRLWSGGWRKKAMNDFARAVIAAYKEKNNANNNS